MVSFLSPPLKPRKGALVKVLGIARISTKNQDERSLADQEALYRDWLDKNVGYEYSLRMIAGQGSGELLVRKESVETSAAVESQEYDLVLTEALSRIFRRMHAFLFCENCLDNGTRLITIFDGIDTGRSDWQMAAAFSALSSEKQNRDTSHQIKRTLRNRFTEGLVFQCTIYGYLKKPGSSHDADVQKDPTAEPIYARWFELLEAGATYAEVADWLNDQGIPTGPYMRNDKWDGRMVARVTLNPILKGERQRNNKMSIRLHKSGHHVSVDAPPEDLLSRNCPHLAFIESGRYDRLVRLLRSKNAGYARGRKEHADSRKGISRKQTSFPGQHLSCGICGRQFYWGGHGVTEHMMCSGARDYLCWNTFTFDGIQASQRLSHAILTEIESLPDFECDFISRINSHIEIQKLARDGEQHNLNTQFAEVMKSIGHVADAIMKIGISQALQQKLRKLESERDDLRLRQDEWDRRPAISPSLPPMDEIKRLAREAITSLAENSGDFGRLMKKLISNLTVYPYRLCDGGGVVLRAKVVLDLVQLTSLSAISDDFGDLMRRELSVNLFQAPQRAEHRESVARMLAEGLTQQEAAGKLGITATAAQKAASLQRLMDQLGLTDPYQLVTEPPADIKKLRRHLHPRYSFTPLEGGPTC